MISCTISDGTVLKRVNTHIGKISSHARLSFRNDSLVIRASDPGQRTRLTWTLPADRINLCADTLDEKESIDISVSCIGIRNSLSSVRKGVPVTFELSTIESGKDEDREQYSLMIYVGSSNITEGVDKIVVEREFQGPPFELPGGSPRVFTTSRDILGQITRFNASKERVQLKLCQSALVILGFNPGGASYRMTLLGELDNEEMDQVNRDISSGAEDTYIDLGTKDVDRIKSLCKIYESPVIIGGGADDMVSITMFPSCFGQITLLMLSAKEGGMK